MPIYEYVCKDCETRYEKIVRSQSDKVVCPRCGGAKHALQLSTFSTPRNGSATASRGAASRGMSSGPACMGNPSACGCSFKN